MFMFEVRQLEESQLKIGGTAEKTTKKKNGLTTSYYYQQCFLHLTVEPNSLTRSPKETTSQAPLAEANGF